MVVLDKADNFQMGRVIGRSFSVLRQNAIPFLILAAVLMVPELLLEIYQPIRMTFPGSGASDPMGMLAVTFFLQSMGANAISFFATAFFFYVLMAAVAQGTVIHLHGEKPSLTRCLSAALASLPTLAGLTLLTVLGLALFSAPMFSIDVIAGAVWLGMMPVVVTVALMWSVVVPVVVTEKRGVFVGLARSRALTKGCRWKILVLGIFYLVILVLSAMALATAMDVSLLRSDPRSVAPPFMIADWILSTPMTALGAVGIAVIYYELRLVKEGVGPQQLASVFD
jgi:hypothetical protein